MKSSHEPYEIGQIRKLKGCFTEEYFLRGLSVSKIGQELGLPGHRLKDGVFVAFALQLPYYHEFELGGWAKYSTDKFVTYDKGKMTWSRFKFEETYAGKRMPISIEDAKMAWLKNMRHEKLIKILPVIPHKDDDKYPSGGIASQIIVKHTISCQIVKFLKGNETFNSVWT